MAKASRSRTTSSKASGKSAKKDPKPGFRPIRWLLRWFLRLLALALILSVLLILLWKVIDPPTTWYMMSEKRRLGDLDHVWVPMDDVAPVMTRSIVAAEDANFCLHWGFDVEAIREAIADGGTRGASTVSQQVVKNVYLWHGRTYLRKALEAGLTPMVEAFWSKRRILEVYLNVAEFDEGVFGIEAASRHYFGIGPEELKPLQAARLAAILPDPKGRSASRPSNFVKKRAIQIRDGAATIKADGRADCFENQQ